MKAFLAKIHISASAKPRICKPHTVSYVGIINPVKSADWAVPIIIVIKHDGTLRICSDYKVTINQMAKVDIYPLPRIKDLLASLG